MQEVARNVYQWSQFSEEKQLDFNGHFVEAGDHRLIIDPPPIPDDCLALIQGGGPVDAILLTNRDHVREADYYRQLLNTKVLAPQKDAPSIDIKIDGTFAHGDRLPGGLQVIQIPDSKSPGESAFLLERDGGILILGDALIGKPAGSLSFLPPDKFADPKKARAGIKVLMGYAFDTVLVGDGKSIFAGGKDAVKHAMLGG